MAKRNRLEIIYDILKIINNQGKVKTTPLLRRSNMSTTRFNEYFAELKEKEFVIENQHQKTISLTNKGKQFLEKYKTMINFIEEFDL